MPSGGWAYSMATKLGVDTYHWYQFVARCHIDGPQKRRCAIYGECYSVDIDEDYTERMRYPALHVVRKACRCVELQFGWASGLAAYAERATRGTLQDTPAGRRFCEDLHCRYMRLPYARCS
jgi:hypothetical protein